MHFTEFGIRYEPMIFANICDDMKITFSFFALNMLEQLVLQVLFDPLEKLDVLVLLMQLTLFRFWNHHLEQDLLKLPLLAYWSGTSGTNCASIKSACTLFDWT